MYTKEGLEHGIEQAKNHIEMLKEAILDQQKTIADYKIMINTLEIKDKERLEAESHVEIVYDNPH